MASEVDICNLALGYLGDDATVASIDPPEGSAQADHCARFYPIARNTLLEMHTWSFVTRRATLALLSEAPPSTWKYAYAVPNEVLNILAVLDASAADDYSVGIDLPFSSVPDPLCARALGYTPQPYTLEIDDTGASVIYTNQQYAVLRYTTSGNDPAKFSPLFVQSLALLLASMLAGPVLKGDTGIKAAATWLQAFERWMSKATTSDANQQRHQVTQQTSWMANR